ncbi:MAG: energy transducer TonB [Spirochaetales bacterium]|nr:energy transducer TonB [Spirochaetales bacterium]
MERWSLYPALLLSFLLHAAVLYSRTSPAQVTHAAVRESGRLTVAFAGTGREKDAGQTGHSDASHALESVNALIQNRIAYPELARRMGYEGPVSVGVSIENGRATRVHLRSSSGFEILDRAALDAVQSYDFGSLQGSLELHFIFRLRDE